MKFIPILAALLGVVSFAHAVEQADATATVDSLIQNVNLDEEPDAAMIDSIIRDITNMKRAEAADQKMPKPTRDTTVCPDFALWTCGYHCVTQVLSHITSCVAVNDVHCLCHHQSEVAREAKLCVYVTCGGSRKRVNEFLSIAKNNCKRYSECSKHAPKATAIHVSGVVGNKGVVATGVPAYPTFYPVPSPGTS